VAAFFLGTPAYAQRAVPAKAYKIQFFELSAKVKSVSKRIERRADKVPSPEDDYGLRMETMDLFKAVHEFKMKTMRSYMASVENGHGPDTEVFLVNQGCVTMDFIIEAINSNIYTHDPIFLELVKEGNSLLSSIEKKL
jgi:hypothetical protein